MQETYEKSEALYSEVKCLNAKLRSVTCQYHQYNQLTFARTGYFQLVRRLVSVTIC